MSSFPLWYLVLYFGYLALLGVETTFQSLLRDTFAPSPVSQGLSSLQVHPQDAKEPVAPQSPRTKARLGLKYIHPTPPVKDRCEQLKKPTLFRSFPPPQSFPCPQGFPASLPPPESGAGIGQCRPSSDWRRFPRQQPIGCRSAGRGRLWAEGGERLSWQRLGPAPAAACAVRRWGGSGPALRSSSAS